MPSEVKDFRKFARVPVHAKVFISTRGSMLIGSVLDLSSGGVLVKSRDKIPVGAQVEVLLKKEQVTAAFVAVVLRETESGFVLQVRSQTYPNPLSKIMLAL